MSKELQEQIHRIGSGELSLQAVLDLGEQDLQAIAAVAFDIYQQGQAEEARKLFEGLDALNPKAYYGAAGLGALALAEEKLDEAQKHLQQAADLNPDDPTVFANLGECLFRKGEVERAVEPLQRALEMDAEQKEPGVARARAMISSLNTLAREVERQQKTNAVSS